MASTKLTTVRMDDELYAAAKATAERLGMSTSEFIRQSVTAWMVWHLAHHGDGEAVAKWVATLDDPRRGPT